MTGRLEPVTVPEGWISRAGWGTAHVLQPNGGYTLLGAEYTWTRCGREVRADQITAAGYEDRCKRCSKITSRKQAGA